jgi:hypothetical protein
MEDNAKSISTKQRQLHEPIIAALIAGKRYSLIAKENNLTAQSVRKIHQKHATKINTARAELVQEISQAYRLSLENEVKNQAALLDDSADLLREHLTNLKAYIKTIQPGTPEYLDYLSAILKLHQQVRTQILQTGKLVDNG